MRPQLNWPFILCPFVTFTALYFLSDIVQFYAETNHVTIFAIFGGTVFIWLGLLTERQVVMSYLPSGIRWPKGNEFSCTVIRIMLYILGVLFVVVNAISIDSAIDTSILLALTSWPLVIFLLGFQFIVIGFSYFTGLYMNPEFLFVRNPELNLYTCPDNNNAREPIYPFLKTPFLQLEKVMIIKDERPIRLVSIDTQTRHIVRYKVELYIYISHSGYVVNCMPNRDLFLMEIRNWLATQITEKVNSISLKETSFSSIDFGTETKISGINIRFNGEFLIKELVFFI